MLYTSIFSDEITVYWEKQWELSAPARYRVTLNGTTVTETDYTHASFKDLAPETPYRLRVDRIEGGKALECLGDMHGIRFGGKS